MAKKKALGRGLSALLNSGDDSESTSVKPKSILDKQSEGTPASSKPKPKFKSFKSVSEIDISSIQTNPFQPRSLFDEEQLNELAQSIKELGIIQPITVRKIDVDSYQLISGERRLRASQLVGLERIPAFVRSANDQEMLEMAIVENIQRQELDPIEVALSYKRLLDECNQTQDEVSVRLGKKRSTISNFLRLLQLQPIIQAGLRDRMISQGHAKALLSISNEDVQVDVYKRIIALQLSVRQSEELAKSIKEKINAPKVNQTQKEDFTKWIDRNDLLSKSIEAKTNIKFGKKGNGKLTINFKNEEDLERIIQMLNHE
ncbi:MAG: ParB/RepB/Spo0J family partition protein [Flavobacteriales bacterium]